MKRRSSETNQRDQQIVEDVRQTVLSANDTLDDLTKARVGERLAEAMERTADSAEARPLYRRRSVQLAAVAAGLALMVGMGWLVWKIVRADHEPRKLMPGVELPEQLATNQVLLPRAIVAGSGPWPNPKLVFGQKVARLEVPAGVGLRASLARRAELTLYGPLELVVERASADRIELRLIKGILVGEYRGREGSALAIRSPLHCRRLVALRDPCLRIRAEEAGRRNRPRLQVLLLERAP